jgi:uncharacterized protein YegL
MELPENQFGDLILPKFKQRARDLHSVGFSLELGAGDDIKEVASPSHTIRVDQDRDQIRRVSLARNSDLPDRDVILDIRHADTKTTMLSGLDSKGVGRFAAVVPSTQFGSRPSRPRRLVTLLDRSGSMQGTPLHQAKKAIEACFGALDEHDQFGLVTFSSGSEVFRDHLEEATAKNRQAARKFLDAVTSDGGTEMAAGLRRAAELLTQEDTDSDSSACGDILIITDGQVFGTEGILESIRTKNVRVHCLGIGSASQDRFLAQLASQTGGVSRFLTPAERVDLPAVELFASIGLPVAQNVTVTVWGIEGSRIAPEPAKEVFSGTPLVIFGDSPAAKELELALGWQAEAATDERAFNIPLETDPVAETLRLLQGSRIISDFESRLAPAAEAEKRRELARVERRLRELSLEYGLASSQAALVAVVKRSGDVKDQIPSTRVVAVGTPEDMKFGSVFGSVFGSQTNLRKMTLGAMPAQEATSSVLRSLTAREEAVIKMRFGLEDRSEHTLEEVGQSFPATRERIRQIEAKALRKLRHPSRSRKLREFLDGVYPSYAAPAQPQTGDDLLVSLSCMLEPDGGMPGKKHELRIANSLAALLFFYEHGNTANSGTFRIHVRRLNHFLTPERLKRLKIKYERAALQVLELIRTGRPVPGSWEEFVTPIARGKGFDVLHFWAKVDGAPTPAESATVSRE